MLAHEAYQNKIKTHAQLQERIRITSNMQQKKFNRVLHSRTTHRKSRYTNTPCRIFSSHWAHLVLKITNEHTHESRHVDPLYLRFVAVILPILPRHRAPAVGLPQHSHPLHFLLTPSSHSWMPERRRHARTGPLRKRVHTHVRVHLRTQR